MATKSNHTPGPWKKMSFDECQLAIIPDREDNRQPLIATVSIGEYRPDGEANADLIVKAPELLTRLEKAEEFLKKFIDQMQYHIDSVSCENTEKLLGWNQKLVNQVKQFLEGK